MVNKEKSQTEIFWWGITLIITVSVLLPIVLNIENYPFFWSNFMYIVVFITLTRYTFLLPRTFLAQREILKIALVFLSVPLVFLLIEGLHTFQTFFDEQGVEAIVGPLSYERQQSLGRYVRSEYLLFSVASIVGGVVFPIRLIISIWRVRNTNKV